jgi:dTDP-glucose 4,6-dehydratase
MMGSDEDLIEFVEDRPGHDLRYAIDNSKIYSLTDWKPTQDFDQNIKETIEWYKNNPNWWES